MTRDMETTNPQITDSITQASVVGIASTPAYGLAQSQLALAQSQAALFANMVSGQQQQAIAGDAAITQCVSQLLNGGTNIKIATEGSKLKGAEEELDKSGERTDQEESCGPLFYGPCEVY